MMSENNVEKLPKHVVYWDPKHSLPKPCCIQWRTLQLSDCNDKQTNKIFNRGRMMRIIRYLTNIKYFAFRRRCAKLLEPIQKLAMRAKRRYMRRGGEMGGETMHNNTRQTSQEKTERKSRDGVAGTVAVHRMTVSHCSQPIRNLYILNNKKLRLLSQCILVPSSLVPSGSP